MSRIVLSTLGTTGDVVPFVALATELLSRGHHVRACSHLLHRARFEAIGVEMVATGPPLEIAGFNRLLETIAREVDPFAQYGMLVEALFLQDAAGQLERHRAASKEADVVVAQRFDYLAQDAAIMNGVPWASVILVPDVVRTSEAPPFPYLNLGSWWTRRLWDEAERKARVMNRRIGGALAAIGAPARPLGIAGALSPYLNLIAASPHIIEPRGDWPSTLCITGPWFLASKEQSLPEPIARFIDAHPHPIVVTFGSMSGWDIAQTSAMVLEAVARAGRAAIVQKGYAGLEVPSNGAVLAADYVPHDLLLPRAGVVVHHAGAGTAFAACRAGVPSVVVPHLFDQYFWAGMLHRRGVAPRPIFRRALTPKALSSRIEDALGSSKMRSAARILGERVRAERGVEKAADAIEALVKAR
jgi:sterol 3beta-glucosyltransferase